jgi:hypothetical protein
MKLDGTAMIIRRNPWYEGDHGAAENESFRR